ncbi:MAG: DUF4139 domain-containing protein [Planctomycetes bacterium]|nr:DUF4139 domain-containing protein [Planctomycetota bacterium]
MRIFANTVILSASLMALAAAPGDDSGVSLTVYSSADPAGFDPRQFLEQQQSGWDMVMGVPGFGLVRETRSVDVPKGVGEIAFTDVAAFIDPTTVSFNDLTDPTTAVLDQRFEFDLVSADKLLERYVDQPVRAMVDIEGGPIQLSGTLLAARGGMLVIQRDTGVDLVAQDQATVTLGALPGGLRTRPTLLWNLQSAAGGKHEVRIGYQTSGLTWRSDYNVTLDATNTKADLSAWVTLLNVCGRAFEDAKLKLIAGDVQRVQPRGGTMRAPRAMAMDKAGSPEGFQEKTFGEYHLYTLPRSVDIPQNASQQIALFPSVSGIPVEKLLVYEGASMDWGGGGQPIDVREFGQFGNSKVDVYVRLKNDKASNLGMPLPAGKMRVFQRDEADGSLEFIGEDVIGHTPRDEKVLIRLGSAFDVVGERKQTDFRVDRARRQINEFFTIEIRNRKDAPVTVLVRERLYRWSNWKISTQARYEKVNAGTIEFPVDVAPNAVQTISYSVEYTW